MGVGVDLIELVQELQHTNGLVHPSVPACTSSGAPQSLAAEMNALEAPATNLAAAERAAEVQKELDELIQAHAELSTCAEATRLDTEELRAERCGQVTISNTPRLLAWPSIKPIIEGP